MFFGGYICNFYDMLNLSRLENCFTTVSTVCTNKHNFWRENKYGNNTSLWLSKNSHYFFAVFLFL